MNWHFAATAFASAFTIIDPPGMIPMTLAVTAGVPVQARTRVVDQAVLIAAVVILVMAFVGQAILRYLGITFPAFRIAGGILLFMIAIDMLFARQARTRQTEEETREAAQTDNPAAFPLAIPMIAGPGTITTVLLLVGAARGDVADYATIAVAFAVTLIATWACMRAAAMIAHRIGTTGINVMTRLLGIILAALAVQFVINGLAETPFFTK